MARSTVKGNPTAVCGYNAYVANSFSNTLAVVDISRHRRLDDIKTGNAPVNPTFNRDWTKLYVSNSGAGTLTIVDTKTSQVVDTIPAGGAHPSGLRFLPDGKLLVISFIGDKTSDPGSLGVMDLATGKLVKTIPVQAQSERFDITPDGKRAYVANLVGQTISVVDLEKAEVIATIPSPERLPFNVLVSPKGPARFRRECDGQYDHRDRYHDQQGAEYDQDSRRSQRHDLHTRRRQHPVYRRLCGTHAGVQPFFESSLRRLLRGFIAGLYPPRSGWIEGRLRAPVRPSGLDLRWDDHAGHREYRDGHRAFDGGDLRESLRRE